MSIRFENHSFAGGPTNTMLYKILPSLTLSLLEQSTLLPSPLPLSCTSGFAPSRSLQIGDIAVHAGTVEISVRVGTRLAISEEAETKLMNLIFHSQNIPAHTRCKHSIETYKPIQGILTHDKSSTDVVG